MRSITIKDLTGGLSLREPELLDNNQFSVLKNFFYNQDKRLETRRGLSTYFVLPDLVKTIEECNAITDFAVSGDANTLATGTAIRGSNSISHAITVAGTSATLSATVSALNITNEKGYLGFWYNVPSGFTGTGFTDVKIRLGTDSSNYYEWELTELTEGENVFVKLLFEDATTTGTLNDASITYFAWITNYTAGYANQADILIDAIRAYSSTSTKPVTSYFFNKDDSNNTKITIAVAGNNMFHFNRTGWDLIASGLTEFETAADRPNQRTRWGFFAYKLAGGVSVGMCNGIDDYRVWNGVTMTTFPSQPKCRYFLVNGDRVFSAGADSAPFTLYFTNAALASINALDTLDVDVGNEFDGKINGLFALAETVLVGKDAKIYHIDVDNETSLPIDYQGGLYSNRVTQNVGNAIMYQSENSIDNIKQKGAAVGTLALASESYSEDLQALISKITPRQYNANCGAYIEQLNNFYFTFDSGDDNIPETTLVYSSLIGKTWTEYTYPAIYQYGTYVDDDNNIIYLACSANGGIIYRIENGFNDNGVSIDYEFKTKKWDFDEPSNYKDFQAVDLYGLKNEGSTFNLEIIVDEEIVYTATIDDSFIDVTNVADTVSSSPIAYEAITGGADSSGDSVDLFRYKIRLAGAIFASGTNIQVRGYSGDGFLVFTLERMTITYDNNTFDIFPLANIA